jgi:hypothetical protein
LERLPSWGQYKAQMAMDDDWAEAIMAQREADEEVAPAADPDRITPLHYTPEISYLALIADRILGAQSDRGEQPIPSLPRPKTAMDGARERRVIRELLLIEQEIFGGGLGIQRE